MGFLKSAINLIAIAYAIGCGASAFQLLSALKTETVAVHKTGLINLQKWNQRLLLGK